MKHFLTLLIGLLTLGTVYAADFTSFQLASTTITTGNILQTRGGKNIWVSTSSLGITASVASSTIWNTLSATYPIQFDNTTGVISTGFSTSTRNAFTALNTFALASTTALTLSGRVYDLANSAGTAGMVLQTSGNTGVVWVATSTLGFLPFASSTLYVPYTGATGKVDLGSQTLTTTGLITSTSSVTTNATSTTGWFSSLLQALNAVFTNATSTNIGTTNLTWTNATGTNLFTTNASTTNLTFFNASGTNLTIAGTSNYKNALANTAVQFVGVDGSPFRMSIDSYNGVNNFGSQIQFRRASSTSASPTFTKNGDTIGSIAGATYTGTNFSTSSVAAISIQSAGQQTNNSNPTLISFYTTATGTVNQREAVKIQSDGTLVATSTIFTNSTTTNATSTNQGLTNATFSTLLGQWLATDLTGKIIATTTFPSPVLSGGNNGLVARWTSTSALSTGLLRDNATVAGVNATSSTVTFNVQGNPGTSDIINVASSSGTSYFKVGSSGTSTIATTTMNGDLIMNGKIIARVVGYSSSATLTVNLDTTDIATTTINQTTAIANPTGSAVDGQMFEIIATATGTRTLTWGTNFASSTDLVQVYTVASGTTRFLFENRGFGSFGAKWDLVGLLKVYP